MEEESACAAGFYRGTAVRYSAFFYRERCKSRRKLWPSTAIVTCRIFLSDGGKSGRKSSINQRRAFARRLTASALTARVPFQFPQRTFPCPRLRAIHSQLGLRP